MEAESLGIEKETMEAEEQEDLIGRRGKQRRQLERSRESKVRKKH